MPFEHINTPSIFMRLMNHMLHAFIGKLVVMYFDDILIYNKNLNEHIDHLRNILHVLCKEQLYGNLKKCISCMEKILFLRYVVTTQCIEKDEEKVKVIQDWPTSKSVTEVRSFYKLVELVREGTIQRYWLEQDLLYAKGGRIFVLKGALQKYLMMETHDPQWAGHPGRERMVALLSQTYYWPKMEDDVELYVRTCLVCQQDKTLRQREAGLLQPLPIPERPWVSVSMDFIVGFLKVDGMNTIMVVVDRFTKYAMFVAAPTVCTAEVAAELFYRNMVKYFGVPSNIVSDRDVRFTGRFWTALFNMIGTRLKFSTANHLQIDGQTERINALLEEYLRHYMTAM